MDFTIFFKGEKDSNRYVDAKSGYHRSYVNCTKVNNEYTRENPENELVIKEVTKGLFVTYSHTKEKKTEKNIEKDDSNDSMFCYSNGHMAGKESKKLAVSYMTGAVGAAAGSALYCAVAGEERYWKQGYDDGKHNKTYNYKKEKNEMERCGANDVGEQTCSYKKCNDKEMCKFSSDYYS